MAGVRPEPDPAELRPLRCPCGSGQTYPECCGRLHADPIIAATAVALMRSRYSAFALGEAAYLLATWDPATRPRRLELDEGIQWRRLEIVETVGGGPFDRDGVVEFRAHYRRGQARGVQRERSRFRRDGRQWFYVAAVTEPG
jgi:SEC-C motif-containing protein